MALAGKRVEEKKKELLRKAGGGPQAQADVHRHVHLWSLRLQLYCRMRENFRNTGQWSWVSSWHFLNYSLGHKLGHRAVSFQSSLARNTRILVLFSALFKLSLNNVELLLQLSSTNAPPSLLTGPHWSGIQPRFLLKFYWFPIWTLVTPSWPPESLPPAPLNSSKIQQSSTFPNSPMPYTPSTGC